MPDPESSADRIVASLHNVDEKVNALREQRINDPDDLCDKMFKVAAPTLAGLVFGKLFELAWRKSVGRKEASCRNRRAAIYRDRAAAVRVCA